MIAGPTEIEKDILAKGSNKMIYFRSEEFSEMVKRINENLKYVFQTKNPVYTITSSGTGGMEFSIVNILNSKDKVLVVNGGIFGERWKKINGSFGVKVVELKVKQGQSINLETIKTELEKDDFSAVFTTVNETSTGALTSVKEIGSYLKNRKELLYVDAISSLCVEELKTDEWGCDVIVAGTQKGLALPPGLSFVSFSEKALRKSLSSDLPKYYFDLSGYKRFYDMGQFPYTPNIPLLFQLDKRLQKIKEEGLEHHIERYAYLTKLVRVGIKALGLELIGPKLANCLTSVIIPKGIDAREVCKAMKRKYGIIIIPTFGEDKERIIRIGNYGHLKPSDILKFISALEKVLKDFNYNVKKGLAKKKIKEIMKNENSNFSRW